MYFCSLSKPPVLENDHHINSGEIIVETGGLLTLRERVRIAQVSGLRLEANKYLQSFDTNEDGSIELIIPGARRPGYDIIDATHDLEQLRDKYRAKQQENWDKQQEVQRQRAQENFNKAVDEEIKKRQKPREEKTTE